MRNNDTMLQNVTYTVYFTISIQRIRRNETKQIGPLNVIGLV